MKYKLGFWFYIIFSLVISCSNNENLKMDSTNYSDSSQRRNLEEKKQGTDLTAIKTDNVKNDSLSNYDVYQFTNDTLIQELYVNYLSARKIKFVIKTRNKIRLRDCEYSGTAIMANGEGTAQGSDDLKDDELYGVYEYFTKEHPFFTIDIEFKRGKRGTIFTKDYKGLSKVDCPLASRGTLHRISLSKVTQHNPTW